MPLVKTAAEATPRVLKPFTFHGVELRWDDGATQAIGDCPFCEKESKLYVNVATGQYECKAGSCGAHGNGLTFLRALHSLSDSATSHEALKELAEDRGLLYFETLVHWGVVLSPLSGHWLIPGWGIDGKLDQLYKWTPILEKGEWVRRLLPTPGLWPDGNVHRVHHSLHFNKNAKQIETCEGPWDGMAMWEILRTAKMTDEGLRQTAAESMSLLNEAEIIAVPGANVFHEIWKHYFFNKKARLWYDSDHPIERQGKVQRAGWDGMRRAVNVLSKSEQPPTEIEVIMWGPDGYDPLTKTGYDVRDCLSAGIDHASRLVQLSYLLQKTSTIPEEWLEGRTLAAKKNGGVELEPLPCRDWPTLLNSLRKALECTKGIEHAFVSMLACLTSTGHIGSQIWLKIISPASSGKSVLCEALSANRRHVYPLSSLTSVISGYKTDKDGKEDHSLVDHIRNKSLVMKEADAIVKSSNIEKSMAQLRDLYDKASRNHFGNGVQRSWEAVYTTLILCGTANLRQLDQSELGDRFLSCYIMKGIDTEVENRVGMRTAYNVRFNLGKMANCQPESQDTPERIEFKRLTAGYIDYLKENAGKLIGAVQITDAQAVKIVNMATLVAYMRARPSKKQDEIADREYTPRLIEQLTLFAACIAAVLGKTTLDSDVMNRIRTIAVDTAHGKTLEIARYLMGHGHEGVQYQKLCYDMGWHSEELQKKNGPIISFLGHIGAFEHYKTSGAVMLKWRLSPMLMKLCREVLGNG